MLNLCCSPLNFYSRILRYFLIQLTQIIRCLTLFNSLLNLHLQLSDVDSRPIIKEIYMKKIRLVFGALMLISSVVLADGIENPSPFSGVSIFKNGDVVRVLYKGDKPTKVNVVIFDEQNRIVFSEGVKKRSEFIRPYNLSNLPEGNYRIVVEDENGKHEESVNHVKESVKVLSSIVNAKEKQKCLVTLFSKGEANVQVTLTDAQKKILASDLCTVNGQVSKLFDLKNVQGPVTVQITGKDGTVQTKIIE